MFKNYFKMAWRSLLRDKLSAVINIVGLSLAVGCGLVAFSLVDHQYTMDDFHQNAESVFVVQNIINRDGRLLHWGDGPFPMAPALKADFPQVKAAARARYRRGVVRYGDKVFNERIIFADPDYLEILTFPLKWGDANPLETPNAVVLSEEIAIKYFGHTNPVGEQIALTFENQRTESFFVQGVAKNFPLKSSFTFTILVPFEAQFTAGVVPEEERSNWERFTTATFVQLHDARDLAVLESGMDKYINLQNAVSKDWPAHAFHFEPLTTLAQNSFDKRSNFARGAHPAGLITISLIALILIALACFNYVNIAVVSATRRLKEIGIRKVVGSNRGQLVRQFLSENLLICMIALIAGGVLAEFIFLPGFNQLLAVDGVTLELEYLTNPALWGFFLILLILTGLGSGAYPAFYISAFKPVNIFRDKLQFGRKNRFMRILLACQFAFSFIAIFAGIVMTQNAQYQKTLDWGYDQAQTIVVPLQGEKFATLKNEVSQNPDVIQIAGSLMHVGRASILKVVKHIDKQYEINTIGAGFNYLETLGLRLKNGRFFNREFGTDAQEALIVNETFVKRLGWESALNQRVEVDSVMYSVVGVVEDFHQDDFYEEIPPMMFRITPEENFRFLSARIQAGRAMETEVFIEETWRRLFPDQPYQAFFQDSLFEGFFREITGHMQIMMFTAALGLILSCMGLFGLVSLSCLLYTSPSPRDPE